MEPYYRYADPHEEYNPVLWEPYRQDSAYRATPLHRAIARGDVEGIIGQLLYEEADPNAIFRLFRRGQLNHPKYSPLTLALESAHPRPLILEIASLLLEAGAEPNLCPSLDTPLELAVIRHDEPLIHLLLNYGADAARAECKYKRSTTRSILEWLVLSCPQRFPSMLGEADAEVAAEMAERGEDEETARMCRLIDLLVSAGADPNYRYEWIDWGGDLTSNPSPFEIALESGCPAPVIERFIANGAILPPEWE